MVSISVRYITYSTLSLVKPISHLSKLQVLKSWRGGSERFFSLLWISHVSSYANLAEHLSFSHPSTSLRTQLARALNDTDSDFSSLVIDFLKGSGVPCPVLFNEAKVHFGKLVDLTMIQGEGFRARMFCWAVTGACDLEHGGPSLSVSLAEFTMAPS